MSKNKLLYSVPETELFVVRFEENIMSPTGESFSSQTGDDNDDDWS